MNDLAQFVEVLFCLKFSRILLTTESKSARGACRHPAFMDGSLLVKCVCPVHLVER